MVGSTSYGGEEPFSEAETTALRDFIMNNKDAVLVVDYHTTNGTPDDDKWIYFEMPPSSHLFYPASDHIKVISNKWKKDNHFGSELEHYGYIHNALGGKFQVWVNEQDVDACVLESSPNIQSNNGTLHRKEIMDMAYENYSNWLIHALKYLKNNI